MSFGLSPASSFLSVISVSFLESSLDFFMSSFLSKKDYKLGGVSTLQFASSAMMKQWRIAVHEKEKIERKREPTT